ncbi:MAG: MFS transporter [Chloroflexi bacterium]|nr:MFS transporter [Chloroflexota bacterium]
MAQVPSLLDRIPEDMRHRPSLLVYAVGFSFGVSIGMLFLLVPLYVLDVGYDVAAVGIVISAQGILQLGLRFPAGAFSDRFGEHTVLLVTFVTIAAGTLGLIGSTALWSIIVMQMFIGIGQSIYWTPSQSYASRSFESRPGTALGRLLSFESLGQMVGALAAGGATAAFGFGWAFVIAASVSAVGTASTLLMPRLPRKEAPRTILSSFKPIPALLKVRSLHLAGLAAFGSATVIALLGSVYPAYFKEVGYNEATIGVIRAVHPIGTMVVAFAFGAIVGALGQQRLMIVAFILTGVLTVIPTFVEGFPWMVTVVMFLSGLVYANMRTMYPTIAAQQSRPEQRGKAIAVVGLYWGAAHLIVPVTFGYIAKALGTAEALWVAGGLFIVLGLLTPVLYKLLLPAKPPPETALA